MLPKAGMNSTKVMLLLRLSVKNHTTNGRVVIAVKPVNSEIESMRLSRIKKIAPLLILFFILSTITAPARAILPLIAEGVMLIAEGGTAANALAALTVGSVAGIIYMGSSNSGAGTKSGSILDIPLGTSRDRPLDVPPGYGAPADNNSQPVPPGSVAPIVMYTITANSITYTGSTPAAACQSYAPHYYNNIYDHVEVISSSSWACYAAWPSNGNINNIGAISPATSCPAGYAYNGSMCALSTPADVKKPPDGRCQILASVNGFAVDPQDPECGTLAAQAGVTVSPTSITANTPGSTTTSNLTINADGTRTLTTTRANADGKTSTITTVVFTPAANGQNAVVSGTSVVVVNGVGAAAGKTAAVPDIKFPDDYNREVTQAKINTGVDKLHEDLDSTNYTLPVPSAKSPAEMVAEENKKITDVLDGSVAAYDAFKNLDWATWVPVFPSGSCSPISGSVMGKTISWDICPKVSMLNELIGWLLNVFAAWSVVNLMLRKD